MMEFIGWAATAAIGGYYAFCLCGIAAGLRGGLDALPRILIAGWVGAAMWVAFIFWLSPITISFGATP